MITIVDYQMGNLHSVKRVFNRLGVEVHIASKPSEILSAKKLILPGVGHFGKAMDHLKETGLLDALNEAVLVKKTPVLGICLGMQLMTKGSEEGGVEGLGWFNCATKRLVVDDPIAFKIPHVGWNTIEHLNSDPLLDKVPSGSEVYFVHSYGVLDAPEDEALTKTVYGNPFVSALKKDNVVGMQFHPEKSHDVGLRLLGNWVGEKIMEQGA
jgi:glutamine amidotransferase